MSHQVFLEEPGKLYTMDVRKAFMHLVGGGKYSALPDNKNYISPPTPAAAPREPSPPRRERKTILPPGQNPTTRRDTHTLTLAHVDL